MNSKRIPGLAVVLSGGLFACAGPGRGNPIAAERQPTQPLPALAFDSIHMIDRDNGWARSVSWMLQTNTWINYKAVLRTTNGGKSWSEVMGASPGDTFSACFHDSQTAWAAAADGSTNVTIFRTEDGGKSWSRSQLHQSRYIADCCVSFSGREEGWLMLIPDHGSSSSPADLYRTSDGGTDWQKVNSTDAASEGELSQAGLEGRHPYLICGGAMAFQNDSTGWVAGSLETTTRSFLFMTRDSGLNWEARQLSLPASLPHGRMSPIGPPRFFQSDSNEGILSAEYRPNDGRSANYATLIYRTHDGGFHWRPGTPVKFQGVYSFITVRKGWIWSAEPHDSGSNAPVKGTLYCTDDGGVLWKPAGLEQSLEQYLTRGEDLVQLDFVDGEHGWAIARDRHGLTQLLHTADGGQSWTAIQTKVER